MRARNRRHWSMSSDNGSGQELLPGRYTPSGDTGPRSVYYNQLYPRRKTRTHHPESRLSDNRMHEALSCAIGQSGDSAGAAKLLHIRIKIALGYYETPCHLEELADILIEKLNLNRSGDP